MSSIKYNFSKARVYGTASINIRAGIVDFEYMTANNHDLMFMIICFFLKIRWMITDEEMVNDLKEVYSNILEKYPSSINDVSKFYINNEQLSGETILNLLTFSKGYIGIDSYLNGTYDYSTLIHIPIVFADKVYQVLNAPERKVFHQYLNFFKNFILDNNQDTSTDRLWYMYGHVSYYRQSMYKHYKRNGIIKY